MAEQDYPYRYDWGINCGIGLTYPSMDYRYFGDKQISATTVQSLITRAQEIINSTSSCHGCVAACQIRSLAQADLDTFQREFFGIQSPAGQLSAGN